MRVKRGALGAVVAKSLVPTQKTFYSKVKQTLIKAGVGNLAHRNRTVTTDAVRRVFDALDKNKMLRARTAAQGVFAFKRKVQAEQSKIQAAAKPKKTGKPESLANAALRQRLMEEAKQKQKIDEALKVGKNEKPAQKKEVERREIRSTPIAAPVTSQARVIPIGTIPRTPRPEVTPTVERAPSAPIPIRSREEVEEQKEEESDIDLPI